MTVSQVLSHDARRSSPRVTRLCVTIALALATGMTPVGALAAEQQPSDVGNATVTTDPGQTRGETTMSSGQTDDATDASRAIADSGIVAMAALTPETDGTADTAAIAGTDVDTDADESADDTAGTSAPTPSPVAAAPEPKDDAADSHVADVGDATSPTLRGWVTRGDDTYYYLPDGSLARGMRDIVGDDTYCFDASDGHLITGECQHDGRWYYFDPARNGRITRADFVDLGSKVVFYGGDGAMLMGTEAYLDGAWRYFDRYDGHMAREELVTLPDGRVVSYDASGAMMFGFCDLNGTAVHFDERDGHMAIHEFVNVADGTLYYGDDGRKVTGEANVDGAWYYLDPARDGRMARSAFVDLGSKIVYYGADGAMLMGTEAYLDGAWRYFDRYDGHMVRNDYVNLGHKIVFYDASGAMVLGREYQTPDGAWHYLDAYDGHLARNEFVNLGHKWVYYDQATKMAFGERNVGGNWFYFDPWDGSMAYDRYVWLSDGRTVYYDESGHMVFGGRCINGELRYFSRYDGRLTDTSDAIYASSDWDMASLAQWYASDTGNLILVDTASNVVGVYEGELGNWREVNYFACADGKPSTPTIHGVFSLGVKGYYFDSGNCRCFYYSQIAGDYLFHSVLYYQTPSPRYVMDGTLGASVSHGCVRLALGDAYYIYAYVPSGTTVVVY